MDILCTRSIRDSFGAGVGVSKLSEDDDLDVHPRVG
jgi:hypothetical protein